MTRPTLALLIPAYNAARFLPRLLNSAHAQSIPFDAIWVYDDCSTDDTVAVAKAHGANILRGQVNSGCSAGKHALALHVQTDWVHFHDADDELLPNFTALAHRWIVTGDRDVILFAYEYRDEETRTLLDVTTFDDASLRADARRYAIVRQINPFCGLYRRVRMLAAGGYDLDPRTLYNEDAAFHIRLAFSGLSFAAESEISIINWRVPGSMSSANRTKCAVAHLEVMKATWARPDARPYRAEIGAKLWANAGVLAAHGAWWHAKEAAELAAELTHAPASAGRMWFRAASRVSPYAAIRLREAVLRLFKPHLRRLR